MESTTIKILDANGNSIERKILFTFECDELKKNYIAYDNGLKDNKQEICVVSYNPEADLNSLEPVVDPEELKMVNDVLNQIMED